MHTHLRFFASFLIVLALAGPASSSPGTFISGVSQDVLLKGTVTMLRCQSLYTLQDDCGVAVFRNFMNVCH